MKTCLAAALAGLLMSGCVSLKFTDVAVTGDEVGSARGVLFFDPAPHLVYSQDEKCVTSINLVMLPDVRRPRSVEVTSGLTGKAAVNFANGMITSISGENNVNIPELIAKVDAAMGMTEGGSACAPMARLFRMELSGDLTPVPFPDPARR